MSVEHDDTRRWRTGRRETFDFSENFSAQEHRGDWRERPRGIRRVHFDEELDRNRISRTGGVWLSRVHRRGLSGHRLSGERGGRRDPRTHRVPFRGGSAGTRGFGHHRDPREDGTPPRRPVRGGRHSREHHHHRRIQGGWRGGAATLGGDGHDHGAVGSADHRPELFRRDQPPPPPERHLRR